MDLPSADSLPKPRTLQKLAVPIISTPKCNLLYSKDAESGFQPRTIKDDMLCAGFAEGKKDACKVGPGAGRAEAGPCPQAPGGNQPTWDKGQGPGGGPTGPRTELCIRPAGKAGSWVPPGGVSQWVCVGLRKLHFQDTSLGDSGWIVWQC